MKGARLLLLALMILLPVGCGRGRNAAGTAAVLRYPLVMELATLDPARNNDIYTAELLQNVYESLVAFDAHNRIAPALAERWEVSADGRTYTFHLRANSRFHAPFARPVTAADVKYSMERALWPETRSPVASNYLAGILGVGDVAAGKRRDLPGVQVVDPRTLTITLDRPRGYFLGALAYPTGCVVCREAIEKNGGLFDEKTAIGTGPFILREYQHGAKVILDANPDYWGGRPRLARIERPIVLDPQTAHLMYENGEVDMIQTARADYVNDQKDPALKAEAKLLPQASVFYLVMHPRLQPAFRDSRVRRAFAEAIDRDQIVRIASLGVWTRADSFMPPGMPGCNPGIRKLPHDPAGARRLLAAAGYPGGRNFPRLTLVYVERQPELSAAAQIIRADLQQNLGITADLQEREMTTFFNDTGNQEKVPFFLTGWIADYPDPQDFLSTLLRTGAPLNHVGYSNPKFDSLCDRADAERDMNKRIPDYRQADQIAMDDVAVFPYAFDKQPMLIKPYVRDYAANLLVFMLPHKTTRIQR
jgi:oligopeptide transport system substrate-binding protein